MVVCLSYVSMIQGLQTLNNRTIKFKYMTRKIKFDDLRSAVNEAYEQLKNDNEGTPDTTYNSCGCTDGCFGIAVVLTDGSVITAGTTDCKTSLGSIAKIPISSCLLSQMTPDEIIQKSGQCPCACNAKGKSQKPDIPFSAHGLRAISAIQPTGDADGKWEILSDRMVKLMGSAPELDDKLYESLKQQAIDANVEDTIAASGYYLYDDAPIAIDTYIKAVSMKASALQLATMGATIASDGVNPTNGQEVFDGKFAQNIVALMAAKGPHKMSKPWLMGAGIPAKSSRSGAMVAVMPGAFGIAAVSPMLNEAGVSVKAAKAIKMIANKLDINVFASARVEIVK